jgi:hypothetical protein
LRLALSKGPNRIGGSLPPITLIITYVGYYVFTEVVLKSSVFWDVTQRGPLKSTDYMEVIPKDSTLWIVK